MERRYETVKQQCAWQVLLSPDVQSFLKDHSKNERQHVKKIYVLLERLADYGLDGVNNTDFFRSEGRFSTGRVDGKDQVVYALKARRIRLYGGIIQKNGVPHFYFVNAVIKKSQKADRAVLERAAKALGELYD